MSSGVTVHPDCLSEYQNLKTKRSVRYVIYKVSDDKTQIVVDQAASTDYDEFIKALPERDCRYGVYDFEYEKPGEGKRNKICFIFWSPDEAPIRSKMVYASSKDAIRRSLEGIGAEVQATDFSEVSYEAVLEKASRHTR
ncbi:cofilin [Tieghemiomyces parasiticus]|uniref:Cofilin n=1 Tax=Tieghemiomyces parasiticus TaxID=78921 RepID=A0A9W8E2I5_9FUNG|nr:cofilin [Tieghemiomyces parasiticus]